jgi:hypothetical protein
MPYRTVKFSLRVFIGFILMLFLTASDNAARAADACLSSPTGHTPQGGHWYYRIDRATKRHCWYVADREKLPSNITSHDHASLENTTSPTLSSKQVADAHAEMAPTQKLTQQPTLTASANSTTNNPDSSQGIPPDRWLGADRWPNLGPGGSNDAPARAIASAEPNTPAAVQPEAQLVRATGEFAAANLSTDTRASPLRVLLGAIVTALVLAGAISGLIYKFGGTRRVRQNNSHGRRRVNWDAVNTNSTQPSAFAGVGTFAQRLSPRPARSEVENAYRDIEEILSRASRRTTT